MICIREVDVCALLSALSQISIHPIEIKIVALLQNKNDEYLVFKYEMDGNYNYRHCHYEVT